jgi:hypothetical protein
MDGRAHDKRMHLGLISGRSWSVELASLACASVPE